MQEESSERERENVLYGRSKKNGADDDVNDDIIISIIAVEQVENSEAAQRRREGVREGGSRERNGRGRRRRPG